MKFVGISSQYSHKILTEYYNFGVSIGFKGRRKSVGNFRPNSDESLDFVGISSDITDGSDGIPTNFILDLLSYYKCIIDICKFII